MQFSAVLNMFIVKHNLILFFQMFWKEKNFFLKMFIVTDLVSLIVYFTLKSFLMSTITPLLIVYGALYFNIEMRWYAMIRVDTCW